VYILSFSQTVIINSHTDKITQKTVIINTNVPFRDGKSLFKNIVTKLKRSSGRIVILPGLYLGVIEKLIFHKKQVKNQLLPIITPKTINGNISIAHSQIFVF